MQLTSHPPAISFDRNSQLFGNFEAGLMKEDLNRLSHNQTEQVDPSNFSDPSLGSGTHQPRRRAIGMIRRIMGPQLLLYSRRSKHWVSI
ncbi:hypothetical protein SDJN03_17116, partial [Cucurbita argyrosperma subsp. sororia]